MPVYLKSIHFSVVLIGVLEGVAEATAGLSKGYFGKLSDNLGKRLPFIRLGYTLSAFSKPLLAFFKYPLYVFFVRTMDRLGKGMRTGARDALLSGQATPRTKGTVFGFHRSMDTLGAVIGPVSALLFLYFHPGNYKTLFYLAFIPGILAIGFTFFIKEKRSVSLRDVRNTKFLDFLKYWRDSPVVYRRLVIGFLIFALFNSSDIFLLLKIKDAGFTDTEVIGVYIFYNLLYAFFAYPLGILADRWGLKNIFVFGLFLFAVVYAGMAFNRNLYMFFVLFLLYGMYAAATEGVAKAWISNVTGKEDTATAIGTFTAFQSICTLIASSGAGFLWFRFGAPVALSVTAGSACIVIIYFLYLNRQIPAQP